MFYDTFVFLCKQKGLSPSKAAIEAHSSKSLVTKWKTNGSEVPSPEVLKKLSAFFNVTPDYL
jgi:transcriptional regulator with XRE-family HTH domain